MAKRDSYKGWNEDEVRFLIENYPKMGGRKLAKVMNRKESSVYNMANRLGLKREWTYETEGKFGYMMDVIPKASRSRFQHRVVYEKAHGVQLPEEVHIHHIDGNKKNNDIFNLVALTNHQHQRLHKGEINLDWFAWQDRVKLETYLNKR